MRKKHRYHRLLCRECGNFHSIMQRCSLKDGLCASCQKHRKNKFIAMCMVRAEYYHTKYNITLWTLGTDLDDTKSNRELIYLYWRTFTKRINLYSRRTKRKYNPLVYIIEAGFEGNKLHIHYLHHGFLAQKFVLPIWRSITNLNSNVNFSKLSRSNHIQTISYLAKYIGKSLSQYYWLGKWLKTPPKDYVSSCSQCESIGSYQYYDTVDFNPDPVIQPTFDLSTEKLTVIIRDHRNIN